jgi:hypothetical protein
MLGDSGGFQILKGQSAIGMLILCAMLKRKAVLKWMDTYMDYGMCLAYDVQSLTTFHMKDKNGNSLHGISTIEEAISAHILITNTL